MVKAARDTWGQGVFKDERRLIILITGGGGDFSVALNVRATLTMKIESKHLSVYVDPTRH